MSVADEASSAAVQVLLERWDRTLPIDPKRFARAMGVEVSVENLDAGISGLIEKRDGRPARIYVCKSESEVRQRFTMAHELGHFIRNPDGDFEYVDRRVTETPDRRCEDERFADEFAAELLMPETVVRQLFNIGARLKQMAAEFNVSVEAMRNRLERLGLLPLSDESA